MCGIAGYFDGPRSRAEAPTAPGVLVSMTDTLEHRGPDGEGHYERDGVGLGHRRLSIVDLAGGAQPMGNEDGAVQVVFNGEIYNHRELRPALEAKGHRFRTTSDTEVLVHLWEEHGPPMVEHLNGMFAFAIWDARSETLFLARDRLGIKPVYWSWLGDRLVFGSELKAVLAHPAVPRVLDPTSLSDYLSFLYVPAPRSIFRDVQKLPPAHTLVLRRGDAPVVRRYWHARFDHDLHTGDADALASELRALLVRCVERRLMAEVPLGAFLSGGVDSSIVVALMTEAGVAAPKTTTIGFEVEGFDERDRARLVAERFGADHAERVVTPDALSIVDRLSYFFDEPFADASAVPTYYLSEATRTRVTVALSGDGGDETYAGYRRYWFDGFEHRMRRWMLGGLGQSVARGLSSVYPKADWLPRPLRAKTLLGNLGDGPAAAYYRTITQMGERAKHALLAPDLVAALGDYDPLARFRDVYEGVEASDSISRAQATDLVTYLADDILTKVDRASMAHSLEVRVPILDHTAVEFAARVPRDLRLNGREHKYLLKRAVRGTIPDEILDGRKHGFEVPLKAWFRNELRPLAESLGERAAIRDHFRVDAVQALVRDHVRGLADHSVALWTLLMFDRWAERFLTPAPATGAIA